MECAFGERDLRWGIFWKRLTNSLDHNILICDAAFHLHNFLVDYRNNLEDVGKEVSIDRSIFVDDICIVST